MSIVNSKIKRHEKKIFSNTVKNTVTMLEWSRNVVDIKNIIFLQE